MKRGYCDDIEKRTVENDSFTLLIRGDVDNT